MDVPFLERLVTLMSDHGLASLELQDGDQRISLSRGTVAPVAAPAPVTPPAAAGRLEANPEAPAPAPAPASSDLKEITSPTVGTFYAAPNPDAAPFVKIGDAVTPATDVCVIEAMKVFNTIQAETAGVIEKVLVENGDPVEFGQALFLVRGK